MKERWRPRSVADPCSFHPPLTPPRPTIYVRTNFSIHPPQVLLHLRAINLVCARRAPLACVCETSTYTEPREGGNSPVSFRSFRFLSSPPPPGEVRETPRRGRTQAYRYTLVVIVQECGIPPRPSPWATWATRTPGGTPDRRRGPGRARPHPHAYLPSRIMDPPTP